jgi:hypothetical protein
MSEERGPDDAYVFETPVALGWGGMIVRDGVASPMPDEMAMELALPQWADEVRDKDAVVDLCLRALGHDPVSLRVVALETLARVVARLEPLPRLAEVRREIQRALDGDDPRLRSAAQATLAAVVRHER